MLESDGQNVAKILELADEHQREIENCLMNDFHLTEAKARQAVSNLLSDMRNIKAPEKGNQLHSLLLYHTDPFDLAAITQGIFPGTQEYDILAQKYIKRRYSH